MKEVLKEILPLNEIPSFAQRLSEVFSQSDIIILNGNLGAGKTTLVRHLADIWQTKDIVTSPTFTLINEYRITLNGEACVLRHVDLYRIEDTDLYDLGLDEMLSSGITFVEWGEKASSHFANAYVLEIKIPSMEERQYILKKSS